MTDIDARILITSAGHEESLGIWKKAALAYLGPKARVFANDLKPSLSAACQLADQSFEICHCSESDYPSHCWSNVAHGIQLVIPTIDTELQALSESRGLFESAVCMWLSVIRNWFANVGISAELLFYLNLFRSQHQPYLILRI